MKKAFLHIGMPKTGTTAVQNALSGHADLARNFGLIHPNTEFCNSVALISKFHPLGSNHFYVKNKGVSSEKALELSRSMWTQIEGSNGDVVLSSEYLHNIGLRAKGMARAFTEIGFTPVFVIYVRHPVDLASSSAQQAVKMGQRSLEEVIAQPRWHGIKSSVAPLRAAGLEVIMRDYETAREKGMVHDFFAAIGYEELGSKIPFEKVNSSLTMDGAILADMHNRYVDEFREPPFPKRLIFEIRGSRFCLPQAVKDEVRSKAAEELRWVSEEFGLKLSEANSDDVFRATLSPEALAEVLRYQRNFRWLAWSKVRSLRSRLRGVGGQNA